MSVPQSENGTSNGAHAWARVEKPHVEVSRVRQILVCAAHDARHERVVVLPGQQAFAGLQPNRVTFLHPVVQWRQPDRNCCTLDREANERPERDSAVFDVQAWIYVAHYGGRPLHRRAAKPQTAESADQSSLMEVPTLRFPAKDIADSVNDARGKTRVWGHLRHRHARVRSGLDRVRHASTLIRRSFVARTNSGLTCVDRSPHRACALWDLRINAVLIRLDDILPQVRTRLSQ